jgi:hypothetical protein
VTPPSGDSDNIKQVHPDLLISVLWTFLAHLATLTNYYCFYCCKSRPEVETTTIWRRLAESPLASFSALYLGKNQPKVEIAH